jgi:hypothetical protein
MSIIVDTLKKNYNKHKKCVDCGSFIENRSTRCKFCRHKGILHWDNSGKKHPLFGRNRIHDLKFKKKGKK